MGNPPNGQLTIQPGTTGLFSVVIFEEKTRYTDNSILNLLPRAEQHYLT